MFCSLLGAEPVRKATLDVEGITTRYFERILLHVKYSVLNKARATRANFFWKRENWTEKDVEINIFGTSINFHAIHGLPTLFLYVWLGAIQQKCLHGRERAHLTVSINHSQHTKSELWLVILQGHGVEAAFNPHVVGYGTSLIGPLPTIWGFPPVLFDFDDRTETGTF